MSTERRRMTDCLLACLLACLLGQSFARAGRA